MTTQALTQRFTGVSISVVRRSAEMAGVGIVFRNREGDVVRKVGYAHDAVGLDEAVYDAVLWVLDVAAAHGQRSVVIYLDSAHLVDQLAHRAKVPLQLRARFVQVRCRANGLGRVRFQLASGERNFVSRRLAQSAVIGGPATCVDTASDALTFAFASELPV